MVSHRFNVVYKGCPEVPVCCGVPRLPLIFISTPVSTAEESNMCPHAVSLPNCIRGIVQCGRSDRRMKWMVCKPLSATACEYFGPHARTSHPRLQETRIYFGLCIRRVYLTRYCIGLALPVISASLASNLYLKLPFHSLGNSF